MPKPYRRVVARHVCLAAAVLLGSRVLAADAGRAALPQPLTLEQAVNQALQYNYGVQAAVARVRERTGEAVHAGRIVPSNPVLRVLTGRRDAPDDTSADIGIRIAQELWTGGKRELQLGAAKARTEAARGELGFLRTSVAARTRRAFLRVLLAREAVRTAQRLLELTREVQTYVQRQLQAGEATQLELNVTAIGVGRAQAELAQARRDRVRTRLALANLLAIDPARELELSGRLRPAELNLPGQDALLQRSLQRRRDLAAAARAVLSARKKLHLVGRQLIPNLTVMGFYQREEATDEIAGVGLSVPLPLLHRFGGEQQAAGARLQTAQVEREALQLQIRREVLQAVADYRAARTRVEVLSGQMLGAAEENLRLTRIAFQAGKLGAPAITAAEDNLLNVRRTYLDALNELIIAGTALERATGGLIHMAQRAEPNNEGSKR
ncbi:MAG: TolC family protein [Nitrococcus mobilis]|nr:TolC family protein [Nitrococcus mobilis]